MATARVGIEKDGRRVVRVYLTVGVQTLALDVEEAEQLSAELPRAVARARTALAAARVKQDEYATTGRAG